jgi:hypothetical protein
MSGRSIYISTMCFLGVILVSGFIFVSNPEIWKGPAPNYFEFFLWPWFAIFVSVVICWVLSNFLSGLRKKIPVISYFNNLSILTATFTFMVVLLSQMQIPSQRSWNFPAEENSIFKVIEKTRVVPGDVFKGRVMTFTGMNLPVGINWSDLQKFDYGTSFSKFGSDFRKADLWYKNIPTLTEYSQTLSATSFQFLRAMFGKQGDGQIRNIMTLRRINLAGLRLVGVKYIVTDLPQKNLKLLTEMSNQSTKFYVYEIQEVNTQGYSPTFVKNVVSNKHALRIIKTRELDYRREALVDRKYSLKSLVAMNSSSLKVLRNGYNVKANTSGTSLLVLPIEFSNCFVVRDRVKQENYFEILPVNYGMLGILFSEDIDLTLEYKFGLFQNQNCRVKDKKRILEL